MSKESKAKITELAATADQMLDKLKNAIFVKYKPISILLDGYSFNTKLKTIKPNITSIVFTKNSISSDRIPTAQIVSVPESKIKTYAYYDEQTLAVYISPEEKDTIIYANENCFNMFYDYSTLTSLDLSNFDTSNVTNMAEMFSGCKTLTSIIGIENFNTCNVTTMSQMFSQTMGLTSLDVSNFDTSSLINVKNIFYYCYAPLIDISKWKFDSLTSTSDMFSFCQSDKTTVNLTNLNTSKITNMSYMFYNATYIKTIGLSTLNMSNVKDMSYMFHNCDIINDEIVIMNPNISKFDKIFAYACDGKVKGKITVNYIDDATKEIAVKMINTKIDNGNGNVVLGTLKTI